MENTQASLQHLLQATTSPDRDRRLNEVVAWHKQIVEEGGGEYVRGMLGDLVLFNSRQTGSTLAVPESCLTAAEVQRKIVLSNKQFGK